MRKPLAMLLILTGMLGLARPSYHFLRRNFRYLRAAHEWTDWKAAHRTSQPGDPIAWLKSDAGGLNYLVHRGTSLQTLLESPGLSEAGGLPQDPGLKVILAHRDIHFRDLKSVKVGTRIELETVDATREYLVRDVEILSPEKMEEKIKETRRENRLVLVTCYPFQYIGPAPQRYVVWAAPEEANGEKTDPSH